MSTSHSLQNNIESNSNFVLSSHCHINSSTHLLHYSIYARFFSLSISDEDLLIEDTPELKLIMSYGQWSDLHLSWSHGECFQRHLYQCWNASQEPDHPMVYPHLSPFFLCLTIPYNDQVTCHRLKHPLPHPAHLSTHHTHVSLTKARQHSRHHHWHWLSLTWRRWRRGQAW